MLLVWVTDAVLLREMLEQAEVDAEMDVEVETVAEEAADADVEAVDVTDKVGSMRLPAPDSNSVGFTSRTLGLAAREMAYMLPSVTKEEPDHMGRSATEIGAIMSEAAAVSNAVRAGLPAF